LLPFGWARDYMLRLIRELKSIARSSDPWIGAENSEAAVITALLLDAIEIVVSGVAYRISDLPPEVREELEFKLSKALALVQSSLNSNSSGGLRPAQGPLPEVLNQSGREYDE